MQTIIDQFNEMLNNTIIPVFEFELTNGEYLTVDLTICEIEGFQGVGFSFDTMGLDTYFDGEILFPYGEDQPYFVLPYNEYEESLQYYLEMIYASVNEGFILPNNLDRSEDQ